MECGLGGAGASGSSQPSGAELGADTESSGAQGQEAGGCKGSDKVMEEKQRPGDLAEMCW